MIKSYIIFVSIIIFINFAFSTSADTCDTQSNKDCKSCLNISGCAYCKNNKQCFPYKLGQTTPCSTSDLQTVTCIATVKTWIIILGSVGGVVLIIVLIIIWCICRKCKQRSILSDIKRQNENDQRMEERRAAAEVRSTERNRVADQIRMKYGLLKEKENGNDYQRMS
ncbi:unnamed protein product [Rotaria sp. Silwood1]|nr:unnamed protein product [Rotaria sp. Silwood1]CAF3408911.1 unnamed protein product [Rotaria sp. Silwood1]CAF3449341.1 unnamed protein product [Rotaria sp. Silwood1]CAF4629891.1 unnamed protein product [Rotaria sp. Silwood1]CAF4639218.1 unnamed protein product [Rotaria sp. Silwood1]